MKQIRLPALAAAAGLSALAAVTTTAAPSSASRPATATVPVTHVVEIMLENHSFDNLFGSFAGADGIPPGSTLPNPDAYYDSAPAVHPVWATGNEGDVEGEINNSTVGEQMAMDFMPGRGYLMDHYTVFPQDGMAAITEFGPQFDPDEQYLASSYELADDNFQPVIAPTQPNVMTALNGTDHGWVYNNLEPGPGQAWNSIFDELTAHGRSWKIYYALPPVAPADTIGFHGTGGILTGIRPVSPGRSETISLEAETGGLVADPSVSGTVELTLAPPPGAARPASFPSSVRLAGGQAEVTASFPSAGYWRIAASGPGGSKGWVTVDVGVSPDTAP